MARIPNKTRNPLPQVMRKYHKPQVVKAKKGKGSYTRKCKHTVDKTVNN